MFMLCCSFYFYLMMLFQFCLASDFFSSPGPRFHESQPKTNCIVFIKRPRISQWVCNSKVCHFLFLLPGIYLLSFLFCDAKVNQGKAGSSSLAGQTRKHRLLSTVGIFIKMKSFLSSRIVFNCFVFNTFSSKAKQLKNVLGQKVQNWSLSQLTPNYVSDLKEPGTSKLDWEYFEHIKVYRNELQVRKNLHKSTGTKMTEKLKNLTEKK